MEVQSVLYSVYFTVLFLSGFPSHLFARRTHMHSLYHVIRCWVVSLQFCCRIILNFMHRKCCLKWVNMPFAPYSKFKSVFPSECRSTQISFVLLRAHICRVAFGVSATPRLNMRMCKWDLRATVTFEGDDMEWKTYISSLLLTQELCAAFHMDYCLCVDSHSTLDFL